MRSGLRVAGLAGTAVVAMLIAPTAQATLLDGQTINYQYYYPNLLSPYGFADNGNKLVGAGVEVNNVADNMATLDISDTNLSVDYINDSLWSSGLGPFNGFVINDVFGTIPSFTSVSVNPTTNLVGFTPANITFNANDIFVNWQGLDFDADTIVSIDINGSIVVPEPTTLSLLGAGLAGLAVIRRRRKAKA